MAQAIKMSLPAGIEKIKTYHWMMFIICFLGNVFGGTTSTLMSLYLPVAVRDLLLGGDQFNEVSAYINSAFILGWAMGGMALGMLSDRIGRPMAIFLSIVCYAAFTLSTGLANTWPWVIAFRFASGFGVGGALVTTPTLLSEVLPDRTKSIFIGILSIGFPIGIFSAGALDLFVTNWRQAFLIGFLPLGLSVLSLWVLRESEKWKSTPIQLMGAKEKWRTLFGKEHARDLVVGSIQFGTMLIGLWAIFSWMPTWVQSLLTASDGQTERGLSMMLLGAGGILGGFFSGWLANAIGLRKSMMICFAGCMVMSFLLFKITTTFSVIIYVEIACLSLFFGASQGVLSAYIPQIFPSNIRATATGFCFNVGRLVTVVIVFFVGALVIALGGYGNAIFIFSLMFLVGLISIFFSKEVKMQVE